MKRIFILLLVIFPFLCQAQDEPPVLSADRPGYTWGTDVMHHHKVSWENGFGFESETDGPRTASHNTIVRYGIFENVELRLGTSFLWQKETPADAFSFGMDPLTIGTKIKVYDGTDILPSIAVLAEFQSPHLGSKALLPSHLAPSMYLIFENDITDWFDLCYNVGAEWDGESATPTTFLSLRLDFYFNDELGSYLESFNYLHPVEDNQYLTSFGLFWQVSRRVQLDLSADLDFQNLGRYFAVNGGVAWMIN